jgi:hypothetical protein
MWASRNLAPPDGQIQAAPPELRGRLLSGREQMPAKWGIYVRPVNTQETVGFSIQLVLIKDEMIGVVFVLARQEFVLNLSGRDTPEHWLYRPSHLLLFKSNVYASLRIWWGDRMKVCRPLSFTNYGDAGHVPRWCSGRRTRPFLQHRLIRANDSAACVA